MSLDISLTMMLPVAVWDRNITHNLGPMAAEAGLYNILWKPNEIGLHKAGDIISSLAIGLADLMNRPKHFETFNPKNCWGTYHDLVLYVREYLAACQLNPDATIVVSR